MAGLVQIVPAHATVIMLYSSSVLPQLTSRAGRGCIKRLISCIRQLAEGVVLIDFANQFFQFSGSLLGSSQTPALFRYIGTLLSNLRLLNGVNKFRPVISGIFSDSPERVGNQCQNSALIDTVLSGA